MGTQDLEAFLAGRKDTTKCLPAGVDITFPPAKRLRTEDGSIAGVQYLRVLLLLHHAVVWSMCTWC